MLFVDHEDCGAAWSADVYDEYIFAEAAVELENDTLMRTVQSHTLWRLLQEHADQSRVDQR